MKNWVKKTPDTGGLVELENLSEPDFKYTVKKKSQQK